MRTPEELLKAYEAATKESPILIASDEHENFRKAMQISYAREDARIRKSTASKITICDRDKLLANGVLSPIDNKTHFSNRRDWNNHLKANDCVEIGNDFNSAREVPGQLRGDYDIRSDLAKATHEVMDKYGH